MKKLTSMLLALSLGVLPAVAMADTAAGKAVYDKTCASCHGPDGRGNASKAKLLKLDPEKLNLGRDEVASQTRDEKKAITSDGTEKMPAYAKKLQPAELDAVLDYTMELIAAIRKK
jgi:mono/diheme cytochrome c family protein